MITIIPLAILECLNSSQDIKVVSRDNKVASRDNKVASRDNKVASRDNMKNLFVAFFKSWWRMWKEKMLSVGHSCPQAGEIIYFILHIPKEYFFKNKITSRDFRIIFHYNLFSNFYLRSKYKINESRSWEVANHRFVDFIPRSLFDHRWSWRYLTSIYQWPPEV